MSRLFHRFRPHATVTFLEWEKDGRRMAYLDADGERRSLPCQASMEPDHAAYEAGMRIGVQFGEADNHTSWRMGGTRWYDGGVSGTKRIAVQMYTGCRCITAMQLAAPMIRTLSLHVLVHHFGARETLRHLRDWKAGASTLQTAIETERRRGERGLFMGIERGVLRAVLRLADGIRAEGRILEVDVVVPDTVLTALPGRPLSAIANHPALADRSLVVTQATRASPGRLLIHTDGLLALDDAISLVEKMIEPLPMAA